MSCEGCEVSFVDFVLMLDDKPALGRFFQEHDIFPFQIDCAACSQPCKLYSNSYFTFRCLTTKRMKNKHKKWVLEKCTHSTTALKNTCFFNSKLSVELITQFILSWLYQLDGIALEEMNISERFINNWSHCCREVCILHLMPKSKRIGGANSIVELEAVKFVERRYNQNWDVDGKWFLGGIADDKEFFFTAVPDRTKETLTLIIRRWIRRRTTIVCDFRMPDDHLKDEGYKLLNTHLSSNAEESPKELKEYDEQTWREVRATIPKRQHGDGNYAGDLAEYVFRKLYHGPRKRIHHFFKAMGAIRYKSEGEQKDVEMVVDDGI